MPSQIHDSHTSVKFKWTLTEFSKLGCNHESGHFALGNLRWKLHIYPKGDNNTHSHFSLFLIPVDKTKLSYVEFSVCSITSHSGHKHNFKNLVKKHQLTHDRNRVGWSALMSLHDLHTHYVQHDTLTIIIKVTCRTREARAWSVFRISMMDTCCFASYSYWSNYACDREVSLGYCLCPVLLSCC